MKPGRMMSLTLALVSSAFICTALLADEPATLPTNPAGSTEQSKEIEHRFEKLQKDARLGHPVLVWSQTDTTVVVGDVALRFMPAYGNYPAWRKDGVQNAEFYNQPAVVIEVTNRSDTALTFNRWSRQPEQTAPTMTDEDGAVWTPAPDSDRIRHRALTDEKDIVAAPGMMVRDIMRFTVTSFNKKQATLRLNLASIGKSGTLLVRFDIAAMRENTKSLDPQLAVMHVPGKRVPAESPIIFFGEQRIDIPGARAFAVISMTYYEQEKELIICIRHTNTDNKPVDSYSLAFDTSKLPREFRTIEKEPKPWVVTLRADKREVPVSSKPRAKVKLGRLESTMEWLTFKLDQLPPRGQLHLVVPNRRLAVTIPNKIEQLFELPVDRVKTYKQRIVPPTR